MKNKIMPRKKNPITWNTNKVAVWKKYHAKTLNNKELEEVMIDPGEDINKLMKIIDTVMEQTKYCSFGKVTESKEQRIVEKLQRKRINAICKLESTICKTFSI